MEKEKSKTFIDRIWDFFASVKLAIIIFAFIALTSVVGTILEQKADPTTNIQILTKLFGESLAPTMYKVFDTLGFMDMYHSWWFVSLLVLFSANIVICSLERLPRIWRLVREPIGPIKEEQLKKLILSREITVNGKPHTVKETVSRALRHIGFTSKEAKEDTGYQLFSQKGNYSRLGVYVTHFSILVILGGALIGVFFGFKGYMNLPEGSVSHEAYAGSNRVLPFGFDIRCDNFDVEFYGRSDMPKEYRSWLTILKDGREVMKKEITVNDPLSYEGITFYQSSYGLVPEGIKRGIFLFKIVSNTGKVSTLHLRLGDTFEIPDTAISGKIIDFSHALKIDRHGHVFTYANQMNNPAVYIEFFESGKQKLSGWILKRYPETWQLPEGHVVEFTDYWGVEFTGLQVRKDPGVWVVYLGCMLMSIGLFIAFFTSHRKIWVRVIEEKNNSKVIVGAAANKNRAAFERKITEMISMLGKK